MYSYFFLLVCSPLLVYFDLDFKMKTNLILRVSTRKKSTLFSLYIFSCGIHPHKNEKKYATETHNNFSSTRRLSWPHIAINYACISLGVASVLCFEWKGAYLSFLLLVFAIWPFWVRWCICFRFVVLGTYYTIWSYKIWQEMFVSLKEEKKSCRPSWMYLYRLKILTWRSFRTHCFC